MPGGGAWDGAAVSTGPPSSDRGPFVFLIFISILQ